jgi:phage head maturation protease
MSMFNIGFEFDKSKTDDEKRQVWGFATLEEPDRQGDIVDYNGSVDAFKRWAGNIREQHDPKKAIGKAVEITPDPMRKGIWLGAYISKSPDGEGTWTKIKEGILNGFSIKGNINDSAPEFRKDDKGNQKRYNRIKAYDLDETSVVDVPACPSASFALVKSVGGAPMATDILNTQWDFPVEPPRLNGTANPFTGLTSDDHAKIADLIAMKLSEHVPGWNVAKRDFDPDVGDKGVDRDKMDEESFAGPERSFPINSQEDVADALQSLGRTKHDPDAIRANIIRIARRKGFSLPDSVKDDDDKKVEKAFRRLVHRKLEKYGPDMPRAMGYPDISTGTTILRLLSEWLTSEQGEASGEDGGDDDDAEQLDALRTSAKLILQTLQAEFDEYFGKPGDGAEGGEYAAAAGFLERKVTEFVKAGARHNADDADDIQKIHKLAVRLGAECDTDHGEDDAMAEKRLEELQKDGTYKPPALTETARIDGVAGNSWDTTLPDATNGTSTALASTGDLSVPHKKVTPQFAREIHGLAVAMGAKCSLDDGVRDMPNVGGNKLVSSSAIAGTSDDAHSDNYKADLKKEAAPKVDDKQGFAQDLHDMSVKFGSHDGQGSAYSNAGYTAKTQKEGDMQPPGNISVDPSMDDNALNGATMGRDVASKPDETLKKSAATAVREIEDMTTQELQDLLSTQFAKSAGDLDKVVNAVGALAGHIEKSNSALDALTKRMEKLEGQPAATNQVVRQPQVMEKADNGVVGGNDERPDYDTMLKTIDAAMDKTSDPREYERLGFQKGYIETLNRGIFAGWTPPSARPQVRQ